MTPLIPPTTPDAQSPRPSVVRLCGAVLAAGAVAWAVGLWVVGDDVLEGIQVLDSLTGAAYVLGLAGLMLLLAAARAPGRGAGRYLAIVTALVLVGAAGLNLLALGYDRYEDLPTALQILDVCWPLGQVLVLAVGVAVVLARRLRGSLRGQLLLCGLWFPVSTVAQILLGPTASVPVSAGWLLLAPALLGVRLAVRPADLRGPVRASAAAHA